MAEAPSSSSYSSSRKHNKALDVHFVTESDIEAAQQLMQLSDEENSNNINGGKTTTSKCKRNKRRCSFLRVAEEEEEVDQKPSNDDIVMAKIQEIFGKDIEDFPSKKQRRYRSLVNIYMATRPIDNAAANDKKERVIGY